MSDELPVNQQLDILNKMIEDMQPPTEVQEENLNIDEPDNVINFKVDEEKIFFIFKPLLARYNAEMNIVKKTKSKVDGRVQRLKSKVSKSENEIKRLQEQNVKLKIMLSDKSPLSSFLALSIISNEEKIKKLQRDKEKYNKQISSKSKKSKKLDTRLDKLQYKVTKFYCLSNVMLSLYSKENRNQLYYDSMQKLNDIKIQRFVEKEKTINEKIQAINKALANPNLYADEEFKLKEKLNKLNTKLSKNSDKIKRCNNINKSLQEYKEQSLPKQNEIIETVKTKVEEKIENAIAESSEGNSEEMLKGVEEFIENTTIEKVSTEEVIINNKEEIVEKQAKQDNIEKDKVVLLQEKFDTIINSWQNNISNLVDLIKFKTGFPKYSLRNTALIFSQRQGAISVNSQNWWNAKGYTIKPNAEPIEVFVPVMDKFLVLENGKRIPFDEAADELKNNSNITVEEKLNHYAKGYVYDISQTTCPIDQYPKPYKATELSTNAKLESIMAFAKSIGINCIQQDMGDNNNCQYQSNNSTLYINSKLDDAEKLNKSILGISYAVMRQNDMPNSPMSMLQTEVLSVMISDVCGLMITNEQVQRLSDKYNAFVIANAKAEKPLQIDKVLEDVFSKYRNNISYKLIETLKNKSVSKKQNKAIHL